MRVRRERSLLASAAAFVRQKPLGSVGLAIMVLTLFIALFGGAIAPYSGEQMHPLERLQGPSAKYWLGTDEFGRDLFSRIVEGARVSVIVGVSVVTLGGGLGLVLGVLSGYFGGRFDTIVQRLIEIKLAFPDLLLALALIAALGQGLDKVIIALSIGFFARPTRVMRGVVLAAKEHMYVEAARAMGATPLRIMAAHILPNVFAPWLILASAGLGGAMLAEASLSFLGLGIPPPTPSWGRMLSGAATRYIQSAPFLVIWPGVALSLVVFAYNVFGDALRDVWDPRLRGSRGEKG
ncbi:MAG: ABC transporter permease [Chloroflexi bacterium]|nr:ABC transporter permease [Chloroflexota bacterium]